MDIVTSDIYSFIYTTIANKIETDVTNIAHIDLYDSQPLRPKDEDAYDLPALFIDFKPTQWVQRGSMSRRSVMQIDIHIETNRTGTATADNTPQTQMARGLYYLDLMKQVYKALQGFNSAAELVAFGSLVNIGDALNINPDVTRVDVMSFQSSSALDNTAVPVIANAPVQGQTIAVSQG
jgi:hypothetical protein